ncbi:hypothetical protein BH11MYX1_BH11MYX1_58060 [soil metagenome]
MKHLLFLIMFAGHVAFAEVVRHVPPADATQATPIELVTDATATTPQLVAHVRAIGTSTFTPIELVRKDDAHWIAIIPAPAVTAPGLEYYLTAGDEPVFASATWPHAVHVTIDEETERRNRDLVRTAGHRSRIHMQGEWVDYGTRTLDHTQLIDRYYRVDADFSYHLWAYPLDEIRVGYTRLLGDTQAMTCTVSPCTSEVGFKVAGWFELGLAPIEGLHLDARAMVMATAAGFAVGGRGELRVGDRAASHIAVGVEAMADVGSDGFFRLGWGTVARFPMSATVEITNVPASDRATGVRLYYDVGHDLGGGVRIGVRLGYAARSQQVAGSTGGLGATVDF